jgi:hypothetical protein
MGNEEFRVMYRNEGFHEPAISPEAIVIRDMGSPFAHDYYQPQMGVLGVRITDHSASPIVSKLWNDKRHLLR